MEQAYDYLPLAACGKKPSLSTLVKERFSIEIVAEIEWYCKLEKVNIRPISIKKVVVTKHDVDEQNLYFDVILDCALIENEVEKPIEMVVDAYFDLDEEFKVVHTRCACPTWKNFKTKAVLPDNLVPVITKKELDSFAVRMINTLYPRASEYAVPISINQVTHRLGLTIMDAQLDDDGDILGKIFFEDASTIITDPVTGIMHIVPVLAGTILINTPVGKILDERIRNNTILHECVHWILHRPAFLLAKLWNQECSAIACRRQTGSAHRAWTDIDRMEWQANALAPRMLMPDWATRFIASGWLRKYSRLSPILKMEKTIDRLSQHFNVSRQLAKIRMEELGYEDARTAFSFYDKRQYAISFENATRELTRNESFQETLASGAYAYVDNCFVIRDSKFIYRDDLGNLHLTQYAKAHMAECCLAFAARRINRAMQYGMLRYNVEDETFITGSAFDPTLFAKQTQVVMGILEKLPATFADTLCAHMKRKGMTVEQLAEASLLSVRNVSRYRNTPYMSISLPTVMSLCIGLKLHPLLATDLIHKAGYYLTTSREHGAYQMLILTMMNNSILECNEYLVKAGLQPLGHGE